MMSNLCVGCGRNCQVDRKAGRLGYCKMPDDLVVAKACLHFGEEPCITGTGGSGTVFFSGCSLGCIFCQNHDISVNKAGKKITPKRLSEIFYELEMKGAENINLVTPSHYVDKIIEALNIYHPNIPIVYNSSGYESVESLKKLSKYIDVYLLDFKFYDNNRAKRYSNAENYPDIAKQSILSAYNNVNCECVFDEKGRMTKGIIIRHLILPQGTNDAINIIDWCKENVPNAAFSLMSQFLPLGESDKYKEINRKITKREYEKVASALDNTDFCVVYTQELNSATDELIPDFNLEGV